MHLSFSKWDSSNNAESPTQKLVLLHGMGGTGSLWRPIAAGLESDFSILALDQRGHGGSILDDPSATYTPLDYGQDAVETLKSQSFTPAFVVGHSMGVRTACALAKLRPDFVQGLILVDLGFEGPAGGGLGSTLRAFLSQLPDQFDKLTDARSYMNQHCPDPAIVQYLLAVSKRRADGKVYFPFDQQAMIKTIDAVANFTLRDWILEFGERQLPVLALRGGRTTVWSKDEYELEKKTFSPYRTIEFREFPDAGHGLPFEKRAEFTQTVRDFIHRSNSLGQE